MGRRGQCSCSCLWRSITNFDCLKKPISWVGGFRVWGPQKCQELPRPRSPCIVCKKMEHPPRRGMCMNHWPWVRLSSLRNTSQPCLGYSHFTAMAASQAPLPADNNPGCNSTHQCACACGHEEPFGTWRADPGQMPVPASTPSASGGPCLCHGCIGSTGGH